MEQDGRTGVFQNRREFEETISARNYFYAVARAYLDVLETPALCAISYDEERPNRKLGAQMIEFKVDCDNGVKAALNNNPSLIEDCNRLIRGEKVPNRNDIIAKVGKTWRKFHLIPHEYFITIKRGRKSQPIAVANPGAA